VELQKVEHNFESNTDVTISILKLKAERGVPFKLLQDALIAMKKKDPELEEIYFQKGIDIVCATVFNKNPKGLPVTYKTYTQWNCVLVSVC